MATPAPPSARALAALSQLAALGSLTEAAEQLGVSRSALSHRIAEFEKTFGVALVRKAGRRLVLTEDGERLLASMGDALERVEAAVQPFRRDRGQIRLSTVATFASHWLIPRLAEFQVRHPGIGVALSTTTRPVDLGNEDIDCAIRHGRGAWKGLASTLLFKETLMPIAAASIADRIGSRAGEGIPLIRARSRFMDWTGVALMDMAYIGPHVAASRLRMLAERPLQLSTGYYFVHGAGAGNMHLLNAFRDWVVEAARPFRSG